MFFFPFFWTKLILGHALISIKNRYQVTNFHISHADLILSWHAGVNVLSDAKIVFLLTSMLGVIKFVMN